MSLKGQRASKKSREQARRRYAIIHPLGYHNETPSKPFHVPWKLFIVLGIILAGIFAPSYIYYSTVYLPSIPSANPKDPFTTLWNGQISSSFSSGGQTVTFDFDQQLNTCGGAGSCAAAQTITHAVTSGEGIVVILSIAGITCLSITDSQSNSFTQQICNNFGGAGGLTIQISTSFASATGTDTVTVPGTGQGYFADFLGYTGVASYAGLNSATGTNTTADPFTHSLSVTGTFSGLTVGTMGYWASNFNFQSATGTIRRNIHNANSPIDAYGIADSASASDSWTTKPSACQSASCSFNHVVLDLIPSMKTCEQVGYHCSNSQITSGNINLTPNATFPGIAISASSIDLSTVVSKAAAFSINPFSPSQVSGQEFGWFLRANATLPLTRSWSPTNDSSVALAVIVVITSGKMSFFVYMQRQNGQSLFTGSENPNPCNQASTLFICTSNSTTEPLPALPLVLNYTGASTGSGNGGQSYLCTDVLGGSSICSLGGANNQQISIPNTILRVNYTQPWLDLQNGYYMGLWAKAGSPTSILWGTASSNNASPVISVFVPPTSSLSPNIAEGGFFGWIGRSLGGAWNAAAGALSPITTPLFSLGNSLLSSFASALIQAGNLLIGGLGILAGLIVGTLNVIGNALGLGNIGNDIATLLTNFQTFFTNQLPTAFSNLGTLFSQWFQSLTILFAWVPIALSIAANLLTIGINAISFLLLVVQDLFLLWDTMIVLMLLLFWFADIGEYGLSGFHVWFETMKYLVFGLGVGPLLDTIHYGTDIILLMVGIIPKPIIQIAAKFDTVIPSIHISGSPTWPSFTMEEVRKGNYFSVGGFLIGVIVLVWFETTSLPGSITALVPGVGVSLTRLAGVPNLLLIFLEIFGFMALFILPAQLFQSMGLGLSTAALGNLQFRRGPGVQVGSVGVSVSRREPGRILQRAEKKIGTNLNAPKGNVSEKKMEQLTKQLGSENIN